jgi:two-component system chemotaxis sensor kinase CheA
VPDLAPRVERLGIVFGVELSDRLRTLHALIPQLEQGGSNASVDPIARELHSLKGAAQAVSASSIEQVAHAAEGAALALCGGSRPDDAWFDALYGSLDCLDSLRLAPGSDISQVIAALVAVTPDMPALAPAPTPIGSARAPVVREVQKTLNSEGASVLEVRPREHTARIEQNSVRVALTKLDTLLTESGELSVTHLRVSQRLTDLRDLQRQLERWQREWAKTRPSRVRLRRAQTKTHARDDDIFFRFAERSDEEIQAIVRRTRELVGDLAHNISQLGTVANAIGHEVLAIRLLPAGTIFLPLEQLARDLSRQTGKDARLVLGGADVEVDRRILDELRDPLMHMVRNMVDHGIELPQEREITGKPPHGTVRLVASQRGDRVQITVEDDGRGLDVEAIRATAIRRNLLTAERADGMDAASLIDFIFHPGFSTRTTVSDISGRGVGMDVVREHVARLGGNIGVRTTPGTGTCFTISVPLTLATTRVLLMEDGGHIYAVPSSSVERTGRVREAEMDRVEGRMALQVDGRAVSVVELSKVLQRRGVEGGATVPNSARPFFVLSHGDRAVALLVDRLVDETELVVKALGAPLSRVRHVAGAAVLGTGTVVVILNSGDLIRSALGTVESAPRQAANEVVAATAETPRRRVLVVDDSVMTRTLERTILESAGYLVLTAGDGQHALEVLNESHVDVIVSDIEMPRMTGLELTAAIRQDERWVHLPIVLITSLDSPEEIERGAAAGADAYITKGRFDQNDLLQTIGRLL